jgi:hypothetical protein
MKQILHIFSKDARRFWPEILISVCLLAALVLVSCRAYTLPQGTQWLHNPYQTQYFKLMLTTRILLIAIVISWWLLITRVLHAERLVGETQFWITRPYEWKRLLGAKLCFLAAFLYLPLVLAQSLILAMIGLNPLDSIPGMLLNIVLLSGLIILPLTAIAAVTSTFFRATLTLLCVLAVVAPFAVVDIFNPGRPWEASLISILYGASFSHLLPTGDQFQLAELSIAACGAALLLQFALRKAWPSRIALLAVPAIIALVTLILPTHPDLSNPAQLNLHYPAPPAGDPGPVQLADGRDEKRQIKVHRDAPTDDFVWMNVPLLLSPIQEGTAVVPEALEITLVNASGFTWKTRSGDWYPEHFLPLSSNRSGHWPEQKRGISFQIPLAVFEDFKSGPVTLHLTLPMAELHLAKVTRVPMPLRATSVPDVGLCRVAVLGSGMINCRSAFSPPSHTYVSAEWSKEPCPAPQTEMEQVRGETWMGYPDGEPADMSIDPVQGTYAVFMPDHNNPTGGTHLCSGTPITFTQYKLVRHTQTSLTIPNIQLAMQP